MYRELTALPALKYASRANDCYVNKTLGQQLCAVRVPLVNECPLFELLANCGSYLWTVLL